MLGIGAILTVLVAWTAVTEAGLVTPAFLPSPIDVMACLVRLAQEGTLIDAVIWSSSRVAISIFFVVLIGVPVGVLMGASPYINATLHPLIDPFRSAPLVATMPVLVMWFGIDELMKIAFLWLGAVVYLVPMVRDAVKAVPRDHIIMAQDLGGKPLEVVWHTIFPIAKPRIADAIIVSVGIEWTYITVAEYVNSKQGLGMIIQNGRRLSASDQVFAGILVILAIALLVDWVLKTLKAKFYAWETV
jgi:ABC-type nitrate/sulfonate/bicarbonate transport system permease component